MNVPSDVKYTKSHEWAKINGNIARVGITDFAQHELGDIVFVELPKNSAEFNEGKSCAVVESVKTASDIYSPVSGRVVKINEKAVQTPEIVNKDPYGEGWLFELEMKNSGGTEGLFSADQYKEFIGIK